MLIFFVLVVLVVLGVLGVRGVLGVLDVRVATISLWQARLKETSLKFQSKDSPATKQRRAQANRAKCHAAIRATASYEQEKSVQVREIFVVHVGGTRCVTSSTDHIMKIHARITLTVEFIRGYILLF